ncbi:Tissue factor pathway inhibitor, partial [Stegodyphus mimosarum]
MKVFILLSIIALAIADLTCPKNQHYETCGSACPLTCKNYKNPPKVCVLMCVSGCFCDKGYLKTDDDQCVKPDECPDMQKVCLQQPDGGPCRANFVQWYYNAKTGTCSEFVYGGCLGNGNRFDSEEECLENCKDVIVWESQPAQCELPAEPGVCRGFFCRYYFDQTTGQCQKFIYGGCGGNKNNFETQEQCEQTCGKRAGLQACGENQEYQECGTACPLTCNNYENPPKICPLMCISGCHCVKGFVKTNDGRCVKPEHCPNQDVPVCEQEKVVGPCRAGFRRFFFNKETRQCELFIYGGCQGNNNNFLTKEDCEATCL